MNDSFARSALLRALRAGRVLTAAALLGMTSLLTACGGGGGGGSGTGNTTVTLSSVTVGPASASVVAGKTFQFSAMALYSDGSKTDVSSTATWSSSITGVATISAAGLATGVTAGTSMVSATYNGVMGQDTLTVAGATLSAITVTPGTDSVAKGVTAQFKATGTYSDNSTKDITGQVTWSSANTAVATISTQGLATATGVSSTSDTITATLGSASGTAALTVTSATLVSLAVWPSNPSIALQKTQQFKAIGTYTDSSTLDLTSKATWTSSAAAVTISNTSPAIGLATAAQLGTSQIGASISGVVAPDATMTVSSKLYAYAANFGGGTVSQYTVAQDGTLTALSTPSVAAGTEPFSISVEPTGEFVFVSNWGDSSVSQYSIAADGSLSPVGAGKVSTGSEPNAVTIDHTDHYAYVANLGESTVSQYTIAVNGSLVPMNTAKVNSGSNPAAVIIDPTNQFAYVANFGSPNSTAPISAGTISQYSIGSGGSLTPMSTPTVATGIGPDALAIAVETGGKYLYVANFVDATVGQYSINSDGSLTAVGTPVSTAGAHVTSIVIDPTNHYLYAANQTDNSISQFTINTDGSLTPMSPLKITGVGADIQALAIDPTGTYLYCANRGATSSANDISQFSIGAGGALTALTPAQATAGQSPSAIAIGY